MQILDSIVDGGLKIPDKADRDAFLGAVLCYLRTGERPNDLPPAADAAWTMCLPVIENSRKKAVSGRKGGNAAASKRDSKQGGKRHSKPSSKNDHDDAPERAAGTGEGLENHAETPDSTDTKNSDSPAVSQANEVANGQADEVAQLPGLLPSTASLSSSSSLNKSLPSRNSRSIQRIEDRDRAMLERFRRLEREGRAISGFARPAKEGDGDEDGA